MHVCETMNIGEAVRWIAPNFHFSHTEIFHVQRRRQLSGTGARAPSNVQMQYVGYETLVRSLYNLPVLDDFIIVNPSSVHPCLLAQNSGVATVRRLTA